ncbi:MAG: hypothetical protein HDT46_10165 [Ruminococcaceae bacterium]|nr:hypothetical protein [Oscillospiraceae bacterium]
MIIKKTAVGNKNEAFIESDFSPGVNIISSDDNNKGKTIEIQSMMYALGNDPAFPTSFEYKDYYHYIEFEVDGATYRLCRFNNGFVLKHNSVLMIFDNVSELKRYWNKHIFALPNIIKNQISKIVDPVLFLQLFFVGQDKKDTSNISHAGFYNKADFYNMLYDICDLSGLELNENEIKKIQDQLAKLKSERELLIKQHKILKSQKTPVSYLSTISDKTSFEKKLSEMEKINSKIAELRKARNTAATRKASWETTLKELRSLNRTMEKGELRCMDCNSTNISFSSSKKNSYVFDVSSVDMRNEIIASINDKIMTYTEEINKIAAQISVEQDELQALMSDEAISLEAIVAYKQDVFSASDAETKIKKLDLETENLNNQLKISTGTTQSKKEQQLGLLTTILNEMNTVYKTIDPNGNLHFDDLFTKKDEVYSGSEATIFHLSRLYALSKTLKHNYPIVADSFRAEDLSTSKENIVLDLYKELPNQVIFTTTLKLEELGKYDVRTDIHHIDYRDHMPSKMLSKAYVDEFSKLLSSLSINL